MGKRALTSAVQGVDIVFPRAGLLLDSVSDLSISVFQYLENVSTE